MLKVTFEPPKIGIAQDVKNILRGQEQKKREQAKKVFTWTKKDRVFVGAVLVATMLLSIYFYFKGAGRIPTLNFGGFGFNQTIILEK